jgi:hypothetical protein
MFFLPRLVGDNKMLQDSNSQFHNSRYLPTMVLPEILPASDNPFDMMEY